MDQNPTQAAPSFQIVRATPTHVALVAPLFDAYRQFYAQSADLAAARDFLTARLADGSSTVLLALASNAVTPDALGFTQLYPTFSSISLRPIWILNDLFVAPHARGTGVGRALLTAARDVAAAAGAAELTLQTAVTNAPAQALYTLLGWHRDDDYLTYVLPL